MLESWLLKKVKASNVVGQVLLLPYKTWATRHIFCATAAPIYRLLLQLLFHFFLFLEQKETRGNNELK